MKDFKKIFLKKACLIYLSAAFFLSSLNLAVAMPGSLAVDYLIETGKRFYVQGNYPQAFSEFEKVLLLDPYHEEALYYIKLIRGAQDEPVYTAEEIISKELQRMEEVRGGFYQEARKKAMEEAIKKVKTKTAVPIIKKEILLPSVPIETEEEEVLLTKISYPPVIRKEGQIGLFIDGEETGLEKQIVIREKQVFLPLREIAAKLYFSVLDLKNGNFKIISPEGISRDIQVSFIEREPVISEEELKDYFSVETHFEELEKAFYIRTKYAGEFQTYAVERPPKEIEQEKAWQESAKKAKSAQEKPATIPEEARPSVQLKGNSSYTIIDYHVLPTYHSLVTSLAGKMYDFDLRYEHTWKDINGVFDHDYTYLNLSQPGLFMGLFDQNISLYPLRSQSQSFTGLKIIKDWKQVNKTTVLAGETDNTVSGASGSVKYLGKIYGLAEEFSPLEWLGLKGALFYLENKADLPALSGTTSFPKNNLVTFTEASLKLPHDLTFFTQLARCDYEPDNEPNASVEDWDWRLGSEINKKRYRLGFAYEFVGDNYASLGTPDAYKDYSGWNAYGNYKVTDKWSLSSSILGYHNNVEEDPNRVSTDNLTYSLSSYYRLPKEQWVNLNFSRFISDPSGPNPGSSSKSNLYRIDYSLPVFLNTRPIINYQHYRNDTSGGTDYYSHTAGTALFKSFGKGSSWYLSQQFTKTLYKSSDDNLNSVSAFNINYVLNPSLSLYHNYSYTRDKTDQATAGDTISESTGLRWQLLPETTLNFEHNVNSYSLDTEKGKWPRNWSIMAYISQGFSFSTPPNFGIIEGWVFDDANANGRKDYSEDGIKDALLYLEDKRETTTNSFGYFRLPYITPGEQKVYLDLSSLSAEYTLKEAEKEVAVRGRKKSKINFALVKASAFKGRVFIDDNLDSVFQEAEEPLEDIAVILFPGEQFRRTNLEGEFEFSYLMPGKYKVRINTEDIPLGYKLVSAQELEIEVSAGEEIEDINFALYLN